MIRNKNRRKDRKCQVNQLNQKEWVMRLESHQQITKKLACNIFFNYIMGNTKYIRMEQNNELNLGYQVGFITFSKRKKKLITFISGPHVHKSSREQYKIKSNRALLVVKSKELGQKEFGYKRPRIFDYIKNGGSCEFSCISKWNTYIEI